MANEVLCTIDKFLKEKGMIILDGGLSNQLSKYNYDFERSELWTAQVLIDRSDLIKNVHLDYLRAGSDIITTVTYQATFQKLREKFDYSDQRIYELFGLAIEMADDAIDEFMIEYEKQNQKSKKIRPLVAISIGSYGAYTGNGNEYKGIYDLDEDGLVEFHRERIDFIASKLMNKRLIAIETIPNFHEAKALIRLLKNYDLNAWISFSINENECISDGTPIEQLVDLVKDVKQIFAIGINCVAPEKVEPILKKLKKSDTNKLIVCYPNNGDLWDDQLKKFIKNPNNFDWIDKVVEWKQNYNLSLIGGCCRIGPDSITRLRSSFI